MSSFSDRDHQAIADVLAQLPTPVKLVFFTQSIGCDMCLPTKQILDELVAMSDKITLEELNVVLDKERAEAYGIDRAPSVVLVTGANGDADHDTRIRFVGAPAGYELGSLIEAVRLASAGQSELSEESKALLASVDRPVDIRVFATPT